MSQYSKSLFTAPRTHSSGMPAPDLTHLPAHMRDSVKRSDPIREEEASGHLVTSTDPISIPGARLRCYVDTEERRDAPRVSLNIISSDGKVRVAGVRLELDQARILHAALGAAIADGRFNPA